MMYSQISSSNLNGDEWCNSIGKVYISRLESYNFPMLIRCNDFFRISQNRDTSKTMIRDQIDEECCGQSETSHTPTYKPTLQKSSPHPSNYPTLKNPMSPTIQETDSPSLEPSISISFTPTGFPTKGRTSNPSLTLTRKPSDIPTKQPSHSRTNIPTIASLHLPSFPPRKDSTFSPSHPLSHQPSSKDTFKPSLAPSNVPTGKITTIYSPLPSNFPSYVQTLNPSMTPSNQPTMLQNPSEIPTNLPSKKLVSSVPSERVPTSKITNSPSRYFGNTLSPSTLSSIQHTVNIPTTEPSNTPFPSFVLHQRPTNRNSDYNSFNSQYPTEMNEEWVPISLQPPTLNNDKDEVGSNSINKTAFAAGIPLGVLVASIVGWKIRQKFFKMDKNSDDKHSETEEEVVNPEQYEHVRIGIED